MWDMLQQKQAEKYIFFPTLGFKKTYSGLTVSFVTLYAFSFSQQL